MKTFIESFDLISYLKCFITYLDHSMNSGQEKEILSPSSTIFKFIKYLHSEISLTHKPCIDLQGTNKKTLGVAHVSRELCIKISRLSFKNKNIDML